MQDAIHTHTNVNRFWAVSAFAHKWECSAAHRRKTLVIKYTNGLDYTNTFLHLLHFH